MYVYMYVCMVVLLSQMSQTESSYHYSQLIHFDLKNYVHRITVRTL